MTTKYDDLSRGNWRVLNKMEQPRSHTPVAEVGGKLFLLGGGGMQFASLNTNVALDPKTGKWETRKPMPTARSGTISCVVNDKIYVIGGGFKQPNGQFKFLDAVEIYDPSTDTWTTGPSMLAPHDYPGGLLAGNHIYIFAGHHPDATKAGPKTDPGFAFCERLNLATGNWEELGPIPTPRFALSAVELGGRLLAMGGVAFRPEGFNNFDHIEEYRPSSNTWHVVPDIKLPWTAAGQANCVIGETLFTFGGYSGDGIHNRAACLDPATKTWKRLPDMPAPRAAVGLGVLGRTVYLFGGWADDGRSPTDTVFAYDF